MARSRSVVAAVLAFAITNVEAGRDVKRRGAARRKRNILTAMAGQGNNVDENTQDSTDTDETEANISTDGSGPPLRQVSLLDEGTEHTSDMDQTQDLPAEDQRKVDAEMGRKYWKGGRSPEYHFTAARNSAQVQLKAAQKIQTHAASAAKHMKETADHLDKYHRQILKLNTHLPNLEDIPRTVRENFFKLSKAEKDTMKPVRVETYEKYYPALKAFQNNYKEGQKKKSGEGENGDEDYEDYEDDE